MLEKGQTGLSMAFDLPTQIGYDSDSPQAEGEVGKVGVSITSIKDMMTAFDGNLLSESLTQGAVIERDFNTILPEDYVAENCSIVAFVNLGGETKEVLQANKVKVVE